ncbi:MAG: protein translocase subunit SecD [Chloroflexi bacterium]|nr:protein translocase subunit SecD [Chloroflexota bacterium]
MRRNTTVLIILLVLFGMAIVSLAFPVLGRKGMQLGLDLQGGLRLVFQADLSQVKPGEESEVMNGVVAVIANRINPLGVTEPNIERRGADQVVVEIPRLNVTETQKERIGRTALLEFREQVQDPATGQLKWQPAKGTVDSQELVLTSSYFKTNTQVGADQFGRVELHFEWDDTGKKLSEQITGRLIGKPLGIFEGDDPLLGDNAQPIAPIVQSVITDRGQITGLSIKEAATLSRQLNAGRLPVPLTLSYEFSVDPLLGENFVGLSVKAGIIALALIMLFMISYYRMPGLVASLALLFYAAWSIAIFKLIPVTLTLAGLAGFITSIGMAVDANVIIFERMKEELLTGRTLGAAVEAGFKRAWTAIWDANFTTFLATIVLYWVGSSVVSGAPVKGFALTLFIGTAVSMFTAITVTRTMLRFFVTQGFARKLSLFTIYARKENA